VAHGCADNGGRADDGLAASPAGWRTRGCFTRRAHGLGWAANSSTYVPLRGGGSAEDGAGCDGESDEELHF